MNQLTLFDPPQSDPLPWSVEEIAAHIEAHADRVYRSCPCWAYLSDDLRKRAWIAAHYHPKDYGINMEIKVFNRAYSLVSVKIGNLPESILKRGVA